MATPQDAAPSAPEDSIDFAASTRTPSGSTDEEPSPAPSPTPDTSNTARLPSLKNIADPSISASSTHIGLVNNARRPNIPAPSMSSRTAQARGGGGLPVSMEEKMRAFHLSRQGAPQRPAIGTSMSDSVSSPGASGFAGPLGGSPGGFRLPANLRPAPHGTASAPAVPKMPAKGGLAARRAGLGGMKLPPPGGALGSGPGTPMSLSGMNGTAPTNGDSAPRSNFNDFTEYIDTKTGTLTFKGKGKNKAGGVGGVKINNEGIEFDGQTYGISLDEVDTMDELGKGNYGTVYKVRHARPRGMRKIGLGLAGNKHSPISGDVDEEPLAPGTTGTIMAMKEIRLELDEAKFANIIMELDILHRCLSPYIIDFYGAFFQEGAVYICIEFMDGGSIDKIYGDGIPENVLRKITYATTQGLKTLKDEHNIIHRDVKPTNILVNTRGQVKICDFGVSGNLVASIAKTNIGCQSYMAPERISGGGMAQAGANAGGGTYSVQSDIWSLGLSIIECAIGRYPYPPETYNNIFSQLSAIVDGAPPDLPAEGYSPLAHDFVSGCLNKIPKLRPTYSMLLAHGWLADLSKPTTITEEDEDAEAAAEAGGDIETKKEMGNGRGTEDEEVAKWVIEAIERKRSGLMGTSAKPALHAAPLDGMR